MFKTGGNNVHNLLVKDVNFKMKAKCARGCSSYRKMSKDRSKHDVKDEGSDFRRLPLFYMYLLTRQCYNYIRLINTNITCDRETPHSST